MKDYYAILGILPDADTVVIRAAYKALMLKFHPDTNRSPGATKRAADLNEAFNVLSDPERRAEYDKRRSETSRSEGGNGQNYPSDQQGRSHTGSRSENSPPPPSQSAGGSTGSRNRGNLSFVLMGCFILIMLLTLSWFAGDVRPSRPRSTEAPSQVNQNGADFNGAGKLDDYPYEIEGELYGTLSNPHGAVMFSRSGRKIFIGNSCDAYSSHYGEGRWEWANGGFLIKFQKVEFGFPKMEPPINSPACRSY